MINNKAYNNYYDDGYGKILLIFSFFHLKKNEK